MRSGSCKLFLPWPSEDLKVDIRKADSLLVGLHVLDYLLWCLWFNMDLDFFLWHLMKGSCYVNSTGILLIGFFFCVFCFTFKILEVIFWMDWVYWGFSTYFSGAWVGQSLRRFLESLLQLTCHTLCCNYRTRKVEEDEYEDSSSNQKWVLAPKSQDTDVTLILNKLLREYDKKLRPDIGSEWWCLLF